MTTIALIVAAGSGSRIGGEMPKQYRNIGGIAMLRRTIMAFKNNPKIDKIRVVFNEKDGDLYQSATAGLDILPPIQGGKTRQDSVRLGLESLLAFAPEKVLVHDAARPFISNEIINNVIDGISKNKGVVPAINICDTIKKCSGGKIVETVSRENLVSVQTPQGFLYQEILDAHQQVIGKSFTDDAAIFESLGFEVAVVAGAVDNFKVTESYDFERAERMMIAETRTGTGFDVHKFVDAKSSDNNIIICGVKVPHDKSLEGHSDADVGIHAVVDALLGAIAAGDIGEHFPPSEAKWKGVDSAVFLEHARDLVAQKNGRIINVDVTIICERPKLMPYKKEMAVRLAEILEIDSERVSVKATTTEGLGFTGRGEGIAAQAVVSCQLPVASC
jgi:2-C-methyl-D-erythritol 4-phosphate cytidylyltransferase/2-C-methyl-D-erythritol 2,4-cyclodiphosphate synthase